MGMGNLNMIANVYGNVMIIGIGMGMGVGLLLQIKCERECE